MNNTRPFAKPTQPVYTQPTQVVYQQPNVPFYDQTGDQKTPVFEQVTKRPVYEQPVTRPPSRPIIQDTIYYPDRATANPRPVTQRYVY